MIALTQTPDGVVLLVECPDMEPMAFESRAPWLPYVARITGRHPKYYYQREWLGRRQRGPNNEQWCLVHTRELRSIDMLIIRDETGTSVYQYTVDPMRLQLASPIAVERWVIDRVENRPIQEVIEVSGVQRPVVEPGISPTSEAPHRKIRFTQEEDR